MSEYFDISPPLSSQLAVFPGDQPLERRVAMSFSGGEHLEVSALLGSVHLGAHADAPSHYKAGGESIEKRDLGLYMGPAQVVHIKKSGRISLADWAGRKVLAPRVLIGTGSFPDPNKWRDDFASYSPELIEWLAGQGVRLIGIDTPSIDPAGSKKLESHQVIAAKDMAVLEGLVLDRVPEGIYDLIALPLKLVGFDASPVRAVLRPSR